MALAVWQDRAEKMRILWEEEARQSAAYRQQIIKFGLVPHDLDPHEGPLQPFIQKKVKPGIFAEGVPS